MILQTLLRGNRHIYGLLLAVAPLCAAGILIINAIAGPHPGWLAPAARSQLLYAGVGLLGMIVVLVIGYQRLGRWSYPMFACGLVMLAWLVVGDLPFVAKGTPARSWLKFGSVPLQPSEIVKVLYVLALAWYLRYRRSYRTLPGLIAPFLITLVPMALILKQPDLGTLMLFLPVLFVMLFVAGAKIRHLLIVILLGLLCTPFFWMKIHDYQRLRILGVMLQSPTVRAFLLDNPHLWEQVASSKTNLKQWRRELKEWESNKGYQLIRSKTAIGSGGLTGVGLGQGPFVERSELLPERHNDFVYAMIANQWGLIGAVFVAFCFVVILIIGCDIATLTNDPFGRLLAVGLATMLGFQAFTNLFVNVGLGPVTGITLPFISAGGSSLAASFLMIGLLVSVAHRRPMLIARRPFEFDEEQEETLRTTG